MVGKQGFIRTMEAVIAILLVLGFLLYILPRQPVLAESLIPESLDSARNFILTELSTNKTIRECVGLETLPNLGRPSNGLKCEDLISMYDGKNCGIIIKELLDKHLIPGFDYACEVCDNVGPCIQLPPETIKKSVYPGSVFIYLEEFNVKYVRVYFWRK